MMQIAHIIESALDEGLKALPDDATTRRAKLLKASASLGGEQRKGEEHGDIDYRCPYRRLAYIHKHTLPRAFAIYNLMLKESEWLRPFYEKSEISVCSIGAGPGCDVLGVLKYLSFLPKLKPVTLTYWLVDRCAEWAASWGSIYSHIPNPFIASARHSPITLNAQYKPFDAGTYSGNGNERPEFSSDCIMCVYNGIEFRKNASHTEAYLRKLFKCAAPGTNLVYVDAYHNLLIWWLVDLAKESGFKFAERPSVPHISCDRGEELQHDLREFNGDFGHGPHWNPDGVYFVGVKQ
jgi:hypothetical protein